MAKKTTSVKEIKSQNMHAIMQQRKLFWFIKLTNHFVINCIVSQMNIYLLTKCSIEIS